MSHFRLVAASGIKRIPSSGLESQSLRRLRQRLAAKRMLGWGSALIAENKELAAYGNLLDTSQAPVIVLDQVTAAATHVESKG